MHVGASSGTASKSGRASEWALLDVNRNDPVDMALAANLHQAALEHVAAKTCKTYTGRGNMFVRWCDSINVPRVPLPATDGTMAMYLRSVANGAKTFAPVKAASAAIAFYHKINLFSHEPRAFAVSGGLPCAGGGY